MLELIRRARRRFFYNDLLAQGMNALSAAVAAIILLLVLGTQILDWRWLVPVFVLAAAAGVYRARRRLPSPYAVAQVVDRRMSLADTLSTALFFTFAGPRSRASAEVREFQLERANRLAGTVDARRAVPYILPRTIYPLAALVLVASTLFALRYGLSSRLDLKPPLARILQQRLEGARRAEEAKTARPAPPPPDPVDEDAAADPDRDRSRAEPVNSADRETPDPADQPEARGKADGSRRQEREQAAADRKSGGDDQQAESDNRSPDGNGDQPASARPRDGKRDQGQQAARPDPSGSGQDSSLLSKVKDAMQNLLSRIKPQQGSAGSQRQSAMDRNGRQDKGQQGGKRQTSSGGRQNGGQAGDSNRDQAGQQALDFQNPQGQGATKGDSPRASRQPGSGIGSEDGAKDLRQARQLAAMGKISEIIGKRSANITGDATVEVQSTSQQLRTPYAQRRALHSEGGAEIGRDEIPVALQAYVEQYFEQVRKQASPKK